MLRLIFVAGAVERGFRGTNLHLPLFTYRRKKQSMLESRQQFDRIAKAQIVANHPSLYRPLGEAEQAILASSAIGRIPESLQLAAPAQAS